MTEETQNVESTEKEVPGLEIPNPESAGEIDLSALQNMSFNRKFRKMLLKQSGYTKLKNKLQFKDWFENVTNNVKNGKQLHASNTEAFIASSKNYIDKKNESVAEFLVQQGHSEERVAEIMEKNMQIQERISNKKLKK